MVKNPNHTQEYYRCSDCKFQNTPDARPCKRVDGETIDFARPWYSPGSDCAIVCCDFLPREPTAGVKPNWTNFEAYFKTFVKDWLPISPSNPLEKMRVWFVLNGNTQVEYGVRLLDYVYGDMYRNGKLEAVKRIRP